MENVHIKKELFFKNVRKVILFSIIIILLEFHLICPALCQENYDVGPSTVQKTNPIKLNSDYADYVKEKDMLFVRGSVNADYEGTVIKCDTMTVNFLKKELLAFGNGSINGGYFDVFGDTITYNYETKEGTVINANCRVDDWYFRGPKIEMKGEKTIILNNGFCTSCDLIHPHYRFSANKIVIVTEEVIKLYMVSFRIGDAPVVFAPYLQFSLKKKNQEKKKRRKGNYELGSNQQDGYFFRTWMPYKVLAGVDGLLEMKISQRNQLELGMDNEYDLPRMKGDLIIQHNNRLTDIVPTSNWNVYGKHKQDFSFIPDLKLQSVINYTNDIYFNQHNHTSGLKLLRNDMVLVTENNSSNVALSYTKPNYSARMVVEKQDKWDESSKSFYTTLINLPSFDLTLNQRTLFNISGLPVYINGKFDSGSKYNNTDSPGTANRILNDYFWKYFDGSAGLSTNFNINRINTFGIGLNYTRNWQDRQDKTDSTDYLNETLAAVLNWNSDLMNVCLLPVRINYSFGWNFLKNQSSTNSMSFRVDSSRGRSRKKGELGAVILASLPLPQIDGSEAVVIPSINDISGYFYNHFSNIDLTMNYDTEKSKYNLRYVYGIKNPLYKPYSVDAEYTPISSSKPLKSFKVVYKLTVPNKFDLTGKIGLLRKEDWTCDLDFRADLFFDDSFRDSKFTENVLVVTKELHCWEMALNWIMRPTSSEFWVKFNIKVIQEPKFGVSNGRYKNTQDGSWNNELKFLTK